MDLLDYATRHLAPLGITLPQAWQRALTTSNDDTYSTPRALDALRRLHAKQLCLPVPTAHYAPVLPPTHPITIATLDEDSVIVRHDGQEATVQRDALIGHLANAGLLEANATHRSLIVDTPSTLSLLSTLLPQANDDKATATIDWWLQRSEHAGTGATFIATQDARKRWVTGEHPDDEANIAVWQHWLRLPQTSPAELSESIVKLTAEGTTLHGLLECHTSDSHAWDRFTRHPRFTRPGADTRREAAIGLTSRNQAAEYYESIRLADPLVAQQAVREGHLLHTTVQNTEGRKSLHLRSQSAVSRFRADTEVQGWDGTVDDAGPETCLRAGVISEITVTGDGSLDLLVTDAVITGSLAQGQPLTLRPRSIDAYQQGRLRTRYYGRLRDQRNWLARTATPPTTRRTVPMDVVIAAASDD